MYPRVGHATVSTKSPICCRLHASPEPARPYRFVYLGSPPELPRLRRRATNVRRLDSAAQSCCVALRARHVEVLDEAAEGVVRDELLALELDARRWRGVVGLEPLLDGAALVGMAVYLLGAGKGRWVQE